VEGPDGRPVARPVDDLRVGDRVAVATRLEVPERDRQRVSMIEVWDAAGLDPWRLMVRAPELGPVVWDRRQEVLSAIMRNDPSDVPHKRRMLWGEVHNHHRRSQLPLGAIRALGIPIPDDARVRLRTSGPSAELPARIRVTDELLWLFGLFVAEGGRFEDPPKSAFIHLSCDAETLRRATKVIERDLGVHVVQVKGSAARSPAIFVHAKLLLLLLDHLGFLAGPKRLPGWILGLPLSRLKWVIEGYREGDGVHSGTELAANGHRFTTTSTELKDDLVIALARFGVVPRVGSYKATFRKRTGDRRYPYWQLSTGAISPWRPLEWDRGVHQQIRARRSGDLLWARITSVTEVPPTELVYDFSVPGLENFWAGSGVMAKNTYGPLMRLDDGRAFCTFTVQALRGEPLTVHGDGSQTRSLCYVDDLIDGIWRLLGSDLVGPVNLGNPEEVTILELARTVARAAGVEPRVEFRPRPVDDPEVRRPDITRAVTELGWKPQVSLEEGVRRTVPWFRRALASQ
jgi:UDP-glucuronate decarboxylase